MLPQNARAPHRFVPRDPELSIDPRPVVAAASLQGEHGQAFYAIWHSVLNSRKAPRRTEIKLSTVRRLSQWLWVITKENDGAAFRLRLVGDGIVRIFGRNDTGKLLSAVGDSTLIRGMQTLCQMGFSSGRLFSLGPASTQLVDKKVCVVELFAAPLSEDGETVSALMGTFQMFPFEEFLF